MTSKEFAQKHGIEGVFFGKGEHPLSLTVTLGNGSMVEVYTTSQEIFSKLGRSPRASKLKLVEALLAEHAQQEGDIPAPVTITSDGRVYTSTLIIGTKETALQIA